MKTIIICTYVDLDKQSDYEDIETQMSMLLSRAKVKIKFNRNVPPWELLSRNCDIYVIDYGGIAVQGARDTAMSVIGSMFKPIEEKPNTLFIVWTDFTVGFYEELIEQDNPGLINAPNVLLSKFGDEEKFIDTIIQWVENK